MFIFVVFVLGITALVLVVYIKTISAISELQDSPVYVTRQKLLNEGRKDSQNIISDIDTSTWKIYRNDKYGFEVRYPANWNFEVLDSYSTDGKVIQPKSEFSFTDQSLHRILVLPNHLSGFDWTNPVETKSVILNGTSGTWRQYADTGGIYGITIDHFSRTQYSRLKILIIPINAREYIDSAKFPEFNAILSTFKFTN